MGENGAGKSTLIKIIAGIYQLDAGEILVDGAPVKISSPADSRKLGMAFIHQEVNIIPHLTVAENILLGRYKRNKFGMISNKEMINEAKNIPNALPMNVDMKKIAGEVDAIEQWKMIINRAISLKSKIIFMDEPTASLTFEEVKELFQSIEMLKQKGVAIVYVTHRMAEVFEISDKITVLRDGKNIGTKATKKINQSILCEMMIGDELTNLFPEKSKPQKIEYLKIKGLNKGKSVKNINFTLRKGEILGVAGLVGAGRTEMAKIIFGLEKRDSGEILLGDLNVKINKPYDSIKQGISLVPEERKKQGIVPDMDVKKNITLASLKKFELIAKTNIINFRKEEKASLNVALKAGLKKQMMCKPVKYMSGGNQQKVVLARWICAGSDIYIFDEPTRGVDVGARRTIYEIMKTLTDSGAAIILISSDLSEIMGLSHRILIMHKGQIKQEINTDDTDIEAVHWLCLDKNSVSANAGITSDGAIA